MLTWQISVSRPFAKGHKGWAFWEWQSLDGCGWPNYADPCDIWSR